MLTQDIPSDFSSVCGSSLFTCPSANTGLLPAFPACGISQLNHLHAFGSFDSELQKQCLLSQKAFPQSSAPRCFLGPGCARAGSRSPAGAGLEPSARTGSALGAGRPLDGSRDVSYQHNYLTFFSILGTQATYGLCSLQSF